MTKLYVGNLPYKFTEDSLRSLFASFGELTSATIIMDKMTGRSKGFGFVELDDAQAEASIKELNGKDVEGRALVVSVARPMEERPRRNFNSNSGRNY